MARTERGRQQLSAERLAPWVSRWLDAPDPFAWWVDADAGVALFAPQAVGLHRATGGGAALAWRGVVRPGARAGAPEGWASDEDASGDSSRILYDLLERDAAAVRDLRGQFTLACWDGRRRRLLLARDHLGQQSMFWRTEEHLLLFCSELAPLAQTERDACRLDLEAAYWYLSFGMPPPGRTLARGVERLPAAHLLCCEPRQEPQLLRYWTPLSAEGGRTASPATADLIQRTLDESIAAHRAREGAQGLFLSGGTDSTYLAATASSLAGAPLTAFTSAFEEGFGMNDDARYAASVSEWLGLPHRVAPLYAAEALEVLEEVVLTADEPCAAWASMTHFRLLRGAREQGVTRMLSGLGADEVFGGYEHFHTYYVRLLESAEREPAAAGVDEFERVLLREDDEQARGALYPGIARFFDEQALRGALSDPFASWGYASRLRAFYRECRRLKPAADPVEMMVAHECQHRIPDLLFANFESISRRAGVEVSYPWLDPDVVQVAAGLDLLSRYRTPDGRFSRDVNELVPGFKHALMMVYERKVPEAVLRRPIKTFTAPFGAWLSDERFAGAVRARLSRSRFGELGFLRRGWLEDVWARLSPGAQEGKGAFRLWAILTLVGWYDRFVDPPRGQ
ncbi:MAG TPA: asparagine synthase-related protein [Pyrinomonadaceae bacterium]